MKKISINTIGGLVLQERVAFLLNGPFYSTGNVAMLYGQLRTEFVQLTDH